MTIKMRNNKFNFFGQNDKAGFREAVNAAVLAYVFKKDNSWTLEDGDQFMLNVNIGAWTRMPLDDTKVTVKITWKRVGASVTSIYVQSHRGIIRIG